MAEPVTVLIADTSDQARRAVRAMLEMEGGFVVAGEASDGRGAVELARALRPDVAVLDADLPDTDGVTTAAAISSLGIGCGVVMVSVRDDRELMRRAMRAGARDFILKPPVQDELVEALRRAAGVGQADAAPVKTTGRLITIAGAKGGVGKTLLASNLAAALAIQTRLPVAAVDLDLTYGSLHSLFGVRPTATWLDLCRVSGSIGAVQIRMAMTLTGIGKLGVLAAPPEPQFADDVDGDGRKEPSRNYVGEVLAVLRETHNYVVADTGVGPREGMLTAMDMADRILVVTVPEIPAVMATAKLVALLLDRLGYPQERVRLIVNMADRLGGLKPGEIGEAVGLPVMQEIPTDTDGAIRVVNTGVVPVALRTRGPMANAIWALARVLATELSGGDASGHVVPGGRDKRAQGGRLARFLQAVGLQKGGGGQ